MEMMKNAKGIDTATKEQYYSNKVTEQSYETKAGIKSMPNSPAAEAMGALPRTIRDLNRRVILKAAAARGTFSVSDIAADVMLSRQSVMKAFTHFIDRQIIVPLGRGVSTETGGKRPEIYAMRPPQRCIAILHRTREMVFRLLDMSANILDSLSIPIEKTLSDKEFVEVIRAGGQKLLIRNAGASEALYGVAMAVGGLVEPEQHSLYRSMYFTNLSRGLPVYDILRDIFPQCRNIQVECIGRMAGQAILQDTECMRANKRVFTIYIDRAITGSFFLDGKLHEENSLVMIEAGHMILDPQDDERCTCGNFGCVESLISLRRVRRSIAQKIEKYPDSCLAKIAPRMIGFEDIFAGSRSGDELCMLEVRRLAGVIGQMIRNTFLVCDPGLVVFMGNFSNVDDVFDKELRRVIGSQFVYTLREGTFDIAYDQRDLVTLETLGCAQSVINAFFEDNALYE